MIAFERHAVIPGGGGLLDHGHAQFRFYRLQTQRTVASHARHHDADGFFPPVLRQGTKEGIDGGPYPLPLNHFQEREGAVQDGHVLIRDRDIHGIGFYTQTVPSRYDPHYGMPLNQFRQYAGVLGVQMGNQNKGHAAAGRHAIEESLEGFETAAEATDSHDIEGISID